MVAMSNSVWLGGPSQIHFVRGRVCLKGRLELRAWQSMCSGGALCTTCPSGNAECHPTVCVVYHVGSLRLVSVGFFEQCLSCLSKGLRKLDPLWASFFSFCLGICICVLLQLRVVGRFFSTGVEGQAAHLHLGRFHVPGEGDCADRGSVQRGSAHGQAPQAGARKTTEATRGGLQYCLKAVSWLQCPMIRLEGAVCFAPCVRGKQGGLCLSLALCENDIHTLNTPRHRDRQGDT